MNWPANEGVRQALNPHLHGAIVPGVIDTEVWDHVDALYSRQFGLPPGGKKREVELAVPYGRMGYPCEVASAAVFLASTEAEDIVPSGKVKNEDLV